ncbi:MAG: hypothetical protein AB8U25_04115 [Rickettsiales endosymbiont of Dermacentor nuttalli]
MKYLHIIKESALDVAVRKDHITVVKELIIKVGCKISEEQKGKTLISVVKSNNYDTKYC